MHPNGTKGNPLPGTTIQVLDTPKDWKDCPWLDKETIPLYNALVREWNDWAEDDPAEFKENWIKLIDRLNPLPSRRITGFARSVLQKAKNKTRATVCWGHCILGSILYSHLKTDEARQGNVTLCQLQQWYPISDIMASGRYNENGPSFPPVDPWDLIPVRGTVQQGNIQGSNGHQQNNTHQQYKTHQQYNTPQQSNSPQENNQSAP
ncbi:hypothetical protein DER46DRAFT_568520 [Fusarium sp. MPI-SDFR-AT-0072]|nr:hypothetical protein DER46DRAFT_568520 [Fusarium sp. MPI-SDFR-AT-0072]